MLSTDSSARMHAIVFQLSYCVFTGMIVGLVLSKMLKLRPERYFDFLRQIKFCWLYNKASTSRRSFLTMCQATWRLGHLILWGHSSTSALFWWPESWEEYTTSGQGSFRGRSQLSSRFSELLFLDVPGTAMEHVRTCGFRRNSSSSDKAPKIQDSVRLKSFENFLVTLPLISSETWEVYTWTNSGSSVFWALLFLVLSVVFLETAASFLLFLKVAIVLRETILSAVKTELKFHFVQQWWSPVQSERQRVFLINATVNWFYESSNTKGYNLFNSNSTFISLIYTFHWRET